MAEEPPRKRFRYQTYNQQLAQIKVDTGRSKGSKWIGDDEELSEDESQSRTPLTTALTDLSLLHLCIPYVEITRQIIPLTRTLPLTLHNLAKIQDNFHAFFEKIDNNATTESSGLDGVFVLFEKFHETVLDEALSGLEIATADLLRIGAIKGLQPVLVEKAYTCLSALFKLLAPALLSSLEAPSAGPSTSTTTPGTILPALWNLILPYLSSDRAHVRTCVASLWSILLRRARGECASRLVGVMLVESDAAKGKRNEEGLAMVLSDSMKGAPHLLHSRANHLYLVLLQHLLGLPKDDPRLQRILVLLTTSLVHHCSAANLIPLQELTLSMLRGTCPVPHDRGDTTLQALDQRQMSLVMRISAVFVGVRKGQRLAAGPQLGPVGGPSVLQRYMLATLSLAPGLKGEAGPTTPSWRRNFMRLLVACLIAGKLADWLSPGVKLIEVVWDGLAQEERFGLVDVLGRLKWLGLEQFILGNAARLSLQTLGTHTLLASKMLYSLAKNGYLDGGLVNVQGGKWKDLLGNAIAAVVRGWAIEVEGMNVTNSSAAVLLLRILPKVNTAERTFLPDLTRLSEKMRDVCLGCTAESAKKRYSENAWSPGFVLGEVLLCLGELSNSSDSARKAVKGIGAKAFELLSGWNWNRAVVHGLARTSTHWIGSQTINNLAPTLIPLLISEDPLIKSDALRILAALRQPKLERKDSSTVSEDINLFQACLDVEEAGMSLHNVRERTTRIRKVGLLLRSVSFAVEEEWILRSIVSFLCSQFKVNFRPLYPDTIEVLAELAGDHSEVVWDVVFEEIKKCTGNTPQILACLDRPVWAQDVNVDTESAPAAEEDKSMHCPNAAKLNKAVEDLSYDTDVQRDSVSLNVAVEAQVPDVRLDAVNYEAQLIGVLKALPALAERHGRDLVPILLNLAERELQTEDVPELQPLRMSQRVYQAKLGTYLELFARMNNPKALHRTEDVRACYLSLLSIGEDKLQGQALACILTFKDSAVLPYGERLKDLLVESHFRDTLTKLSLGMESETIDPAHRSRLLPVVIRLLFGIMTARKGRNSNNQGSAARKHAILASLGQCHSDELETLIDLMVKPFGAAGRESVETVDLRGVSGKRQTGFLTLLGDVIKHLAPQTMPYWPRLLRICQGVTGNAQSLLAGESGEDGDIVEADLESRTGSIPARTIRQLGLRRLAGFFGVKAEYDFGPFMPDIFASIISPRLATFAAENTQAPSALMEIFLAWSRPEYLHYLVDYDDRVLAAIFACLGQAKTKNSVIKRVFDLVEALLRYTVDEGAENTFVADRLLRPYMDDMLANMARLMSGTLKGADSGKDELVKRAIVILGRLSPMASSVPQARDLIDMLTPLLKRPGKKVSERVKTDILSALLPLYALVPDIQDSNSDFYGRNVNLLSTLFRSMRARPARNALTSVYSRLAQHDSDLIRALALIEDLNAFSEKRMDEPDFDRRLRGFAVLNDGVGRYPAYSTRQWIPILHNLLFFVQDPEELSIRTNASHALQRFLTMASETQAEEADQLVLNVVYPALRHMIGSRFELVRAESVGVLAHAVKTCTHLEVMSEMTPLLAAGDQEASVFYNLYHLQIHRRTRAIHRLAELAATGGIREITWANLFLPIIGHVVTDPGERVDHTLVNAAISSIGKIAGVLSWPRYQSLVLSYLRLGKLEGRNQKQLIRTVTSILDNFHFEMEHVITETAPDDMLLQEADDADGDGIDEAIPTDSQAAEAEKTSQRISDYVVNKLLPALNDFVAQKDEAEFTIRIPVALGIIQVAMALPEEHKEAEIARTVLTLSQVLRSKDQDTRDLVKETMSRIAVRLGPRWLSTILREMRGALQRGPQLQVLAVVTHAILVHAITEAPDRFANLDGAVDHIAHISAEVIWGQSGADVMTDGFRTKMREVRSAMSRGYDSYQIAARLVSPAKISRLLLPIKSIMQETHAIKQMQQVDECLRRIASGLNANKHVGSVDLLRLCHTLINANSDFFAVGNDGVETEPEIKASHKVQMKRKLAIDENHFQENSYKLVAFGLDLFVTAFRRGRFDFGNPDLLARMNPLVTTIGNTLYAKQSPVIMLGLRASAAIIQCPLPSVDKALPTFVHQMIGIIKRNGSSADSEVAMIALKCLAVIIRDCKAAHLKEKQVSFLLEIITPDLEEHEKQATLFAVLRAIVSRKLVVAEIYDLMEKVSSIMVTSQSSHVQELCRSVLIQFLLDYPQGKGRLRTQMSFLAQNLSYVYESGRVSVMELLSAIFSKFSEDLIEEYSDIFFLALIMVVSNDDAEKCRKMAGALLVQLLARYDAPRLTKLVEMVATWSGASIGGIALLRSSAIVSGLLVQGATDLEPRHTEALLRNMGVILRNSAADLVEQEMLVTDSAFQHDHSLDYTLPYHALCAVKQCIAKGGQRLDPVTVRDVIALMLFPHDWVRVAACDVLELSLMAPSNAAEYSNAQTPAHPTTPTPADLVEIAKKSCFILRGGQSTGGERDVASGKLCDHIVRLIFLVAKTWTDDIVSSSSGTEPQLAEEVDEDDVADGQAPKSPLTWLMSRLSFVARNLIIHRPSVSELISKPVRWTAPLASVFHIFAALFDVLPNHVGERYLRHVLSPLYRIAGDVTDFNQEADEQNEAVYNLAVELREMVQTKVGMTKFSTVWEDLRAKASEKRGQRRRNKEEMAVANPEGFAQRKEQRGIMKKDSKKRKQRSFADAKQRERPVKARRAA